MNNYPSSNFSTVFFLVVIFIGMGLLIYHTVEITVENGQLEEAMGTLQAHVATLKTENAALKTESTAFETENAAVKTKNTSLTDENSRLKTALEKAVAENTSLKASDAGKLAELEKLRLEYNVLRLENQQLKALQGSGGVSSKAAPEVLQSSFLPTGLEFWMKLGVIVLAVTIFLLSYAIYYALSKDIRRKRAAVLNEMYNGRGSSRKSRYTHIIDSHFVDR